MTVIRDSGYKQAPSGNVAVDFVWGNLPPQTNDDRSGSSVSYNATGGGTGSVLVANDVQTVTAASASGGTITYTANNDFTAGQPVTVAGLLGSVTLTGASGSGTTMTFTTSDTTGLSAGTVVTIAGITTTTGYNGTWTIAAVSANTNFTVTGTVTGTAVVSGATCTYSSAFNLTGVKVATASATQFTVTNATTDRAVSGASGTATVFVGEIPGIGADYGWGTTTDYTSNVLVETQPTVTVGQAGAYTVPADNNVVTLNGWNSFPQNYPTGGFNSPKTLQATVTAVSGDGTTVTYTAHNNFSSGQTVTITGLYNYVSAGSSQPIATQYYAPTYTTPSAYNLSSVTIASATPTSFTVTNSTTDTALSNVVGTASVTIAASGTNHTVPSVTGLTVTEAIRQLGVAQYEVGTVTYTSSGATAANNETVYSQTPSSGSSHPYGTQISLVVYQVATNETEAASATNATEFSVEE